MLTTIFLLLRGRETNTILNEILGSVWCEPPASRPACVSSCHGKGKRTTCPLNSTKERKREIEIRRETGSK